MNVFKKISQTLKIFLQKKKISFLDDKGFSRVPDDHFKIITPVPLEKGKKQLNTFESNKSRMVTKLRNVIERVFVE